MSAREAVSCLQVWFYLLSFLPLTAVAQREARRAVWLFGKGKEKQTLPAALFRFAFVGAAVWPLIRLTIGDIPAADPVHAALDGEWIGVLGHALIAIGASVAILSQRHKGAS